MTLYYRNERYNIQEIKKRKNETKEREKRLAVTLRLYQSDSY